MPPTPLSIFGRVCMKEESDWMPVTPKIDMFLKSPCLPESIQHLPNLTIQFFYFLFGLFLKMTWLVRDKPGFVLNMTGYVPSINKFFLNKTEFFLNMMEFVINMIEFVLNMTEFTPNMIVLVIHITWFVPYDLIYLKLCWICPKYDSICSSMPNLS